MYPVLIKFQWLGRDVIIGSYGVSVVIALAFGIFLSIQISKRLGYKKDDFLNYSMLIVVGALFGAFLTGFLIFLPERIEHGFMEYPPALVSWGGMLGGFITLIVIKKKWNESLLNMADIFTPGYLAGLGIGRIGCHFAGCCYGVYTSSCIGVTFTEPAAPASIMKQPLVPTQLISAVFLFSIGLVFMFFVFRRKIIGLTFVLSIIVYSIFRYTIEIWRAGPPGIFT